MMKTIIVVGLGALVGLLVAAVLLALAVPALTDARYLTAESAGAASLTIGTIAAGLALGAFVAHSLFGSGPRRGA